MTTPSSTSAPITSGPKITLISAAQIAGEISAHKWQDINLSDSGSESVSILILVERILSILLIRLLAILYKRDQIQQAKSNNAGISEEEPASIRSSLFPNLKFKDLSTSGICQCIIGHPEKETLQWPDVVTDEVIQQLHDYIYTILDMYRSVSYHNREHAYHVFMSGHKLLDLVLCEYDWSSVFSTSAIPIRKPNRATYGIKTDPLLQLAFLYSALVHDVDHTGVNNRQLVLESDELAIMYNDQSCAEQRSLAIAFSQLMKKEYASLKKVLFETDEEYMRFRKTVIDLVLCTDIASPERVQIVKSKWKEAFGDKSKRSSSALLEEDGEEDAGSDVDVKYYTEGDKKEMNLEACAENSLHESDLAGGSVASSPQNRRALLTSNHSDANLLAQNRGRPGLGEKNGSRGSVRRHCLKHNTAEFGNVLIDIGTKTSIVGGAQNSTRIVKKKPEDVKAKLTETFGRGGEDRSRDRGRDRRNRQSQSPPKFRLRKLLTLKSFSKKNKSKRNRKKSRRPQRPNYFENSEFAQGDSDVAIEENDDSDSDFDYRPANGVTDISGLTASCAFPLRDSVVPPQEKREMHEFLDQYDEDLSYDSERSSESSSFPSKKGEDQNGHNQSGNSKILQRQTKSFGDALKKSPEKEKTVMGGIHEPKMMQTGDSATTMLSRGPDGTNSSQENLHVWRRASTKTVDRRFTDPPESSFNRKKFHIRLGIRRALDLSGNQISLYDVTGSKRNLRANDIDEPDELKAIVVLEQLLKASDVAANMQSWETAVLWCKRLFKEQMVSQIRRQVLEVDCF